MKNLLTKEEKKEALAKLPLGTKYYKCYIKGFWLNTEENFLEQWGYVISEKGFKEAERLFSIEVDQELDILDYGFMIIAEFEKTESGNKRIQAKINNFGKWIDIEEFLERNYPGEY